MTSSATSPAQLERHAHGAGRGALGGVGEVALQSCSRAASRGAPGCARRDRRALDEAVAWRDLPRLREPGRAPSKACSRAQAAAAAARLLAERARAMPRSPPPTARG
jgi:hypothetical protein